MKITKLIVTAVLVAATAIPVSANEWKQDSKGWWYEHSDGSYTKNAWESVNGVWYAFDNNGYMRTGWFQDAGKWYYLNTDGSMAVNTTVDGYKIGIDGVWVETVQTVQNNVVKNPTLGMKNALNKANQYLEIMPFSYFGLIKQLKFEKYSDEEATYAADNCGANWNEQASKKAKTYLDIMPFSKTGLKKQLEFEDFTSDQAEYGVNSFTVDWNEQAAKKAKDYLEIMSFSKEGLISQLEFEGFTHEQAVYGVTENGY